MLMALFCGCTGSVGCFSRCSCVTCSSSMNSGRGERGPADIWTSECITRPAASITAEDVRGLALLCWDLG